MRESFGGAFMLKVAIVFIVIYVSFMAIAINYAKAYGTAKGGTGRLMTVEEARGITGTESGTINSPAWIKTTSYWLSSASSDTLVWNVYDGGLGDRLFGSGSDYGVRPVIEISKSKIS